MFYPYWSIGFNNPCSRMLADRWTIVSSKSIFTMLGLSLRTTHFAIIGRSSLTILFDDCRSIVFVNPASNNTLQYMMVCESEGANDYSSGGQQNKWVSCLKTHLQHQNSARSAVTLCACENLHMAFHNISK